MTDTQRFRGSGVFPPPMTNGRSMEQAGKDFPVDPMTVEALTEREEPVGVEAYYQNAKNELGKVIKGEDEAKLAYIVGSVVGGNVLLLGGTGVGKSVLLNNSRKLFRGLEGPDAVKSIPPQSDLSGKEVTGGTVSQRKEILQDGNWREELTSTTIEAILHPEVRIITGDEINRANPLALGAALEALESGEVETNAGRIVLDGLEFMISAINPRGVDRTVFPLGQAFISRNPIGVYMGENPDDTDSIEDGYLTKKLSSVKDMQPIAHIDDLQMYRRVAESKAVQSQDMPRIKQLVRTSLEIYRDNGIKEGLGRYGRQVIDVASGLAALGNNATISTGDVLQAVKFGMVSRLGASEVTDDPHAVYKDFLKTVNVSDEEIQQWQVSKTHRLG